MNHLLDRHFIEMSSLFSLKKKMSSAAVKMNEQGQTIKANGIYFQRKQHNSHEMSSLIKMSSAAVVISILRVAGVIIIFWIFHYYLLLSESMY